MLAPWPGQPEDPPSQHSDVQEALKVHSGYCESGVVCYSSEAH